MKDWNLKGVSRLITRHFGEDRGLSRKSNMLRRNSESEVQQFRDLRYIT